MTKDPRHTPRLYVETDLAAGRKISLGGDQTHYLRHVMRMKEGEALRLFNGRDGEFLARLGAPGKNTAAVTPEKQLRPQHAGPDIWLCPAPIKKTHFNYMIEKATELGAAVLQPVLTERTQVREVNTGRCRSIAIEAAEQSERLDIPEIRAPMSLAKLIESWPKDRDLVVCAELGEAIPIAEAFSLPQIKKSAAVAILTGPEGGFAAAELGALGKVPDVVFIRLGPRILRADTAAIAALSLWQALCGDWK